MTDEEQKEDDAMRALLKRAVEADAPPGPPPNLLRGVQRKIRRRSRGKFFADGWSTTEARTGGALWYSSHRPER